MFTFNGKVVGSVVGGKYAKKFNGKDVEGGIPGCLKAVPPPPNPAAVNVKPDDGVSGGAPWHRRTYIGFMGSIRPAR